MSVHGHNQALEPGSTRGFATMIHALEACRSTEIQRSVMYDRERLYLNTDLFNSQYCKNIAVKQHGKYDVFIEFRNL